MLLIEYNLGPISAISMILTDMKVKYTSRKIYSDSLQDYIPPNSHTKQFLA